ncbi:MAG TPA: GTPase Era, partial [Labilithrix sp.]|nr:GTPase Era [Labilithrix sp.]
DPMASGPTSPRPSRSSRPSRAARPGTSKEEPKQAKRPSTTKKAGAGKAAPKAGTIALIGRPNVGKSTLLNAMLGTKLAITSHHPQTTRDRIAGILTAERTQYVFLDTPGVHKARNRLGQRMNDLAVGTAEGADVVLFLVDVGPTAAPDIRPDDAEAIRAIPTDKPTILVVNKIDRIVEKPKLFDFLAAYAAIRNFSAVVPLSAKKRDGVQRLLEVLASHLPEGEPLYPEDELSDRPVRFFVAELVREQVLMRTRQEVPHGVAVTVDAYEEPSASRKGQKQVTRITLTIHVAKESHKGIIIGQGGKMLTAIGTAARERAERLLEQKVHLDIRVKATPDWFDDAARLVDLGYGDEGGGKPKKKERGKHGQPRSPRNAP